MSFYSGIPSELLYSLAAPVTKNTYTTQAVFSNNPTSGGAVAMVPANFFSGNPQGLGRALRLTAAGTMATTSAATLTIVVGYDATVNTLGGTLTSTAAITPTAAVTCPWVLDLLISATAVSGGAGLSLYTSGFLRIGTVASGSVATANQEFIFSTALTGMSAVAQAAIELWGTWSASAAGNTTTVNQMILAGLN